MSYSIKLNDISAVNWMLSLQDSTFGFGVDVLILKFTQTFCNPQRYFCNSYSFSLPVLRCCSCCSWWWLRWWWLMIITIMMGHNFDWQHERYAWHYMWAKCVQNCVRTSLNWFNTWARNGLLRTRNSTFLRHKEREILHKLEELLVSQAVLFTIELIC
jgi:hypothetical protein